MAFYKLIVKKKYFGWSAINIIFNAPQTPFMKYNKVLGIDIGGSGVKGAPVNTDDGLMLESRYRIPTPVPATPQNVAPLIAEISKHFNWEGPIGCGFPGVMQNGVAKTAANLDDSWIETNINKLFKKATGLPVFVINDADAAGLAEMKFGAGVDANGVVLLCTIGTGIGTVLFVDGTLVPNTEFGHIELMGMDAEKYAADAARKAEDLSWEEWAKRFDKYLVSLEKLVNPDLIILGGGASKKGDRFLPLLTVKARVLPAELLNNAGLVGAALAANYTHNQDKKEKKKKKGKKSKSSKF
jgi:polyphosphate glucokinase